MSLKKNEFRIHQRTIHKTLLMLYFLLSYNRVEGQKKAIQIRGCGVRETTKKFEQASRQNSKD
uniref:Uncharacterized protein n=1 Tax=Solanum lycopersicum TaxID=4081 RepID=A0A494GA91_SOLLC